MHLFPYETQKLLITKTHLFSTWTRLESQVSLCCVSKGRIKVHGLQSLRLWTRSLWPQILQPYTITPSASLLIFDHKNTSSQFINYITTFLFFLKKNMIFWQLFPSWLNLNTYIRHMSHFTSLLLTLSVNKLGRWRKCCSPRTDVLMHNSACLCIRFISSHMRQQSKSILATQNNSWSTTCFHTCRLKHILFRM